MRTYRLYLFNDHVICGRFDFQADNDHRATEVAEILFDACSDRCRSWEMWEENVFLAAGPRKLGTPVRASDVAEQIQESIIQFEETVLLSKWAIASSERLLAELGNLKASRRGASRYSPSS
jgi:hypothetical protein